MSSSVPNCTLFYSLHGLAVGEFQQQSQQLRTHLVNHNIKLIDLNQWDKSGLSGREKMAIRKTYQFPRKSNYAVLIDENEAVLNTFKHDVNVVSVLLSCPKQ